MLAPGNTLELTACRVSCPSRGGEEYDSADTKKVAGKSKLQRRVILTRIDREDMMAKNHWQNGRYQKTMRARNLTD
jgi:hypothetical protein